ncbi:hypothetical protein [Kitasatospora sp. NPDC059827]|uniref:hypothetical protein n=1 Tax=Kitasatospora sp. NPDC059827 TaxID=3346964 RepID=UPI0036688C7E
MDEVASRLRGAWEWWHAAIEDSQEGHWIRTDFEREVVDDIAAVTVGGPVPSGELPWRGRLARMAMWGSAVRLAAKAGGWELTSVVGVDPPRPAGMAELLSALYAVGELGELWLIRLKEDGPPSAVLAARAEAFLFGPGSAEDLRQFFYD